MPTRKDPRPHRYVQPKYINGIEHWLCKRCKEYIPREKMGRRLKRWNGLNCYCLECIAARGRERWARDVRASREQSRVSSNRWAQKNREKVNAAARARSRISKVVRTPAYVAREAVKHAVYKGRLRKPEHCQECGALTPAGILHGHHEDYSRKLDVEWLCPLCHGRRHRIDTTEAGEMGE